MKASLKKGFTLKYLNHYLVATFLLLARRFNLSVIILFFPGVHFLNNKWFLQRNPVYVKINSKPWVTQQPPTMQVASSRNITVRASSYQKQGKNVAYGNRCDKFWKISFRIQQCSDICATFCADDSECQCSNMSLNVNEELDNSARKNHLRCLVNF